MSDTDTRLAEITARAEAATAGPWTADSWEIHGPGGWVAESCDINDYKKSVADGTFIANARTDIPFLLALVAERDVQIAGLLAAEPTLDDDQPGAPR